MAVNVILVCEVNRILPHILELLLLLLILCHLLLLLLMLGLRQAPLQVRLHRVGVLDGVGAAANLALVARSPVIWSRLVRRLIIETLLGGLRFGVFVVHHLNSIKVASPIPLSCVRSRSLA